MGIRDEYTPPPFEGEAPRCTTKKKFNLWLVANEACGSSKAGVAGFCTDCNSAFQADAIKAGRCERPFIEFHIDADGFTEGYISSDFKREMVEKRRRQRTRVLQGVQERTKIRRQNDSQNTASQG